MLHLSNLHSRTKNTASILNSLVVVLLNRRPQTHRLGLVASSTPELITQLRAFADGGEHDGRVGTASDDPKVAFLYPGQGAQRLGMLRDARNCSSRPGSV